MMAMAASPTPNHTSSRNHSHPPYKEMIMTAVELLKDRKGSNKKAIMEYIAANYNDLPPAHDALLSYHLGRLKEEGVLQMVRRSYKLANLDKTLHVAGKEDGPAFDNLELLSLVGVPTKRGRPSKKSNLPGIEMKKKRGRPRMIPTREGICLPSVKRKPGSPRKMPLGEKRKRGRLKKGSLLLIPKPAAELPTGNRRKPGRPKKSSSSFDPVSTILSLSGRRKQDPPWKNPSTFNPISTILSLGEKRKRGRPKKSSSPFDQNVAPILSLGEKRKRGRPKKSSSPFKQNNAPISSLGDKRKRGRPKKSSSPFTRTISSILSMGERRKRGRPRKSSSPFTQNIATVLSSGEKRKPGRPRKGFASPKLAAPLTSGEKRKRGQPKKVLTAMEGSTTAVTPQAPATFGQKRKRGRPKKVSEVKSDGHGQPRREPATLEKSESEKIVEVLKVLASGDFGIHQEART